MDFSSLETFKTDCPTTFKRDFLLEVQNIAQKYWSDQNTFEASPDDDREKYFVNFPFPYMNGKLHLGHSFTMSKCEFAASFQRMQNKNTIFPFGFHVTGMPIKACADKLTRELDQYGCPPDFLKAQATASASTAAVKSKVAAKTGNATHQWDLLKSIGVPEDEIHKFADVNHWLDYFPPLAIRDITSLGLKVDWRRSFLTTPANPFFDTFVRWQFNTLNRLDKIKFGKRLTIFSPKDNQPCMDHDRQSGEGVGTQSYTLIKMQLLNSEAVPVIQTALSTLAVSQNQPVYLVAGTLRPETMYGQTNCWVKPDMEYLLIQISYIHSMTKQACNELIVCGEHAAKNLSYQMFTETLGQYEVVSKLTGHDLLGQKVKVPFSKYDYVYVLPMTSIKENKGTGIVTSVPSDSPDDYINFKFIQKKPDYYTELYPGLTQDILKDFIDNFSVIEIINVPDLGSNSAETVINEFKINSPKDSDALQKAKEIVYLKSLNKGTLLVVDHQGKPVNEAKPLILDALVRENWAIPNYNEPEKDVISRSGDLCVVALVDQWYIDYGNQEWKASVAKNLDSVNTFCDETHKGFLATIDWLREWACSRGYGLGSVLPWDPQYLIESLSDSTIYMAYYTIAHYFHQGSLTGQHSLIRAEDLDDHVWDYVFLRKPLPADHPVLVPSETARSSLTADILSKMQSEFDYWYPFDLRVSGKDLVPNHLTFSLFNHVAIWNDQKVPKAIRSNGHLLLNGEKMSKSTGNFMTLQDAICKFGADATRFTLADAGDGIEDANFAKTTANAAILKLYTFIEWSKDYLSKSVGDLPVSQQDLDALDLPGFNDKAFYNAINRGVLLSYGAYKSMNYREVLMLAFYDLQAARDEYLVYITNSSSGKKESSAQQRPLVNHNLILYYIFIQVSLLVPFTPHLCEYLLSLMKASPSLYLKALLKEHGVTQETFAVNVQWPQVPAFDTSLLSAYEYLSSTMIDFRKRLISSVFRGSSKNKSAASRPTKKSAIIYVAHDYPQWQKDTAEILKTLHTCEGASKLEDSKHILSLCKESKNIAPHFKKLMPFVQSIKEKLKRDGPYAVDLVSSLQGPFSDANLFGDNLSYIQNSLELDGLELVILNVDTQEIVTRIGAEIGTDDSKPLPKRIATETSPGSPSVDFIISY